MLQLHSRLAVLVLKLTDLKLQFTELKCLKKLIREKGRDLW